MAMSDEWWWEIQQYLAGSFFLDWDEHYLDPDEALEDAVRRRERVKLDRIADQLQDVLDRTGSDEELRALVRRPFGVHVLPDHREAREFLAWARDVARTGPADSEPLDSIEDRIVRGRRLGAVRASRFTDTATAETATAAVSRAHEADLRAWAAGTPDTPRSHWQADLGQVVGQVTSDEVEIVWEVEPAPVAGTLTSGGADVQWQLEPDRTVGHPASEDADVLVDATSAVVVLERLEDGRVQVVTSYPDKSVDPGWRERYPLLPHLLGAHFGMDWDADDETVWGAEVTFRARSGRAALAEVAGQLEALLADVGDDEELRTAVEALGTHVLPEALRPWLRRVAARCREDSLLPPRAPRSTGRPSA